MELRVEGLDGLLWLDGLDWLDGLEYEEDELTLESEEMLD